MTRINCIDPSLLSTKHLVAEYRELPRIFGNVRNAIRRGERPTDNRNPPTYRLGTGHVRFFYPRLGWLHERQQKLIVECLNRGINIQHTDCDELVKGIPEEWFGSWQPTETDKQLNISRINQRGGLRK